MCELRGTKTRRQQQQQQQRIAVEKKGTSFDAASVVAVAAVVAAVVAVVGEEWRGYRVSFWSSVTSFKMERLKPDTSFPLSLPPPSSSSLS